MKKHNNRKYKKKEFINKDYKQRKPKNKELQHKQSINKKSMLNPQIFHQILINKPLSNPQQLPIFQLHKAKSQLKVNKNLLNRSQCKKLNEHSIDFYKTYQLDVKLNDLKIIINPYILLKKL